MAGPVQGKLVADFASFYDACQKAEVSLRSFESGSSKVNTALNRMADSFSGRKIITEATLMAEAIEKSGGITKLTTAELDRAGNVASQAAEKMKVLGIDVPPNIAKLATASKDLAAQQQAMLDTVGASGGRMAALGTAAASTAPQVSTVSSTFKQFDGILASLGINVQRQVKGLEDVTNAAIAGTSGFAKYAISVGAAAAAFKTGWDFGRWIADVTGADAAVEQLSRKLLGLGDVAAETAAAKLDVINRAIAMGARESIGYTEAIEFITKATKRDADAKIDWTQRLADAHKEVRNLSDAQKNEIAIAQEAGATTEQLSNKYKVSAEALKILADRHRDAARAADEHRRQQEALDRAYDRLMSDVKNANQMAIFEAEADRVAAEQKQKRFETAIKLRDAIYASAEASNAAAKAEQALVAEQAKIDAENQRLIQSYTQAGVAATAGNAAATQSANAATGAYVGLAQQITVTGEAMREWLNIQRYTNAANAILSENSLFSTASQRDRLANLSIPTSRGNASGGGTTVNLTVQGSVVSSFDDFRRLVEDTLIGGQQRSGIPLPASA